MSDALRQWKDGDPIKPETIYVDYSKIAEEALRTGKAMRLNTGKTEWSYVDFDALVPLVDVLKFGANKYTVKDDEGNIKLNGRDQWKKGLDMTQILESMMRHLIALMGGEELDKDSGLPHEGHIMANVMFYSHFKRKK